VWSEQRERERQAAVAHWMDTACERADWAEQTLARYRSLREAGDFSEAVVALIEAGDLAPRPVAFWEAVQHAAELLWLDHPWATSNAEHNRRMEFLRGLDSRIKGWNP
jgi:hypothetical protein